MKIVIIGVYFGSFPDNMPLWLKSCSFNPRIDFLIFTDQVLSKLPNNVRTIEMTLKEFSELAARKLKIKEIDIKRPYKCCDFKPVYGVIFNNYIKQYDYWGHCDFDLIFGDVLANIDDDAWGRYDKILPLGHLSFYKNTEEVNSRYKLESLTANYEEVFTNDKPYAFDEFNGVMNIYERNKFPFYKERVFADIDSIYKRFRLSQKKGYYNDRNYKHQVFYWEDGRVFRTFINEGRVEQEEYAYIHFKKRKDLPIKIKDLDGCERFFVTRYGFIEKDATGKPTKHEIKTSNPYYGCLIEKYEYLTFRFNNMMRKIKLFLVREKK